MSTVTEVNPRLLALTEAGVSVWLDQIRRSLVTGGELARWSPRSAPRGHRQPVDLPEGDPRLEGLRRRVRGDGAGRARPKDLRGARGRRHALAADLLAGLHHAAERRDGFISLEVSPSSPTTPKGRSPR